MMVAEKQDANLVGFYKAREASLGVLPAAPIWLTREPNSFDDLGGEYTKVARRPFSPSRQRKKGSVTDLDADGGYNEDLTQNNMQSELEEFFFAALRRTAEDIVAAPFSEDFTVTAATDILTVNGHGLVTGDGPFQVASTTTLPAGLTAATDYWVIEATVNTFKVATSYANALAGTAVDITDAGTGTHTITRTVPVATADDSYTLNHVPASLLAGSLILASGYAIATNNGLKLVSTVAAPKITVSTNLTNETPPAGAKVKVVGFQFTAGDLEMTAAVGNTFILSTTTQALDVLGLIPGQWVFIGGGEAGDSFVDAGEPVTGYARIAVDGISENAIAFDKSTFTPFTTDGAGKTVRLFFGDLVKNEDDPDLIKRFSSTIERTLGRDDNGIQSEFLTGAVANELTWNSPLANLVNLDLSYIAQKANTRNGTLGPLSRRPGNTIVKALGEDAFNTSSNIFRLRMALVDPNTLNPTPLFARVTEWTLTVANNVASSKAQGVLGGFDTTVGNFDVDGEFTAYFSTVEAIHAVQCNYDLTFDAIYAKQNAGVYIDIPLIGLGGGRLDIEQDAAIMLPLETAAAESPFGHTALIGWFSYLPNAAMPDMDC